MPDDTIEQPKETCGLMIIMEGEVSTTINLFAKKEEVISKIQNYIEAQINVQIQFDTGWAGDSLRIYWILLQLNTETVMFHSSVAFGQTTSNYIPLHQFKSILCSGSLEKSKSGANY